MFKKFDVSDVFKVLHEGLTGNRPDVTHTLLKFTGPRFFSLMLPGYTAYVLDFLFAANAIVSTAELKVQLTQRYFKLL